MTGDELRTRSRAGAANVTRNAIALSASVTRAGSVTSRAATPVHGDAPAPSSQTATAPVPWVMIAVAAPSPSGRSVPARTCPSARSTVAMASPASASRWPGPGWMGSTNDPSAPKNCACTPPTARGVTGSAATNVTASGAGASVVLTASRSVQSPLRLRVSGVSPAHAVSAPACVQSATSALPAARLASTRLPPGGSRNGIAVCGGTIPANARSRG